MSDQASGLLPLFVIIAIGAVIYAIVRHVRDSRGGTSAAGGFVCPTCGSRGEPRTVVRGSIGLEIVLWLCFLIPGLIYSVWRLTSKRSVCPACGAPGMIPVDTPRGRALIDASQ